MTDNVVVLGAGYAGAGAVVELQSKLDSDAQLTWIADVDYHLLLHEVHRVVRDPNVQSDIVFPVDQIADPSTQFIQATVTGLDVDERVVELDDADDVEYDYVVVALGTQTAFYGIPGLEEHALTLKSLNDALEIHETVTEASKDATRSDPAQVVVGGAGLSGIQVAGEVAEFRDNHRAPIDVHLVEALDEIFPSGNEKARQYLRELLEEAGIQIHTGDPITEADAEQITFDEGKPLEYDVLVWTGGITGRDALADAELENEHNRVTTEANFQTSDERVFALGDAALIDQGDQPAPPTSQAAWQAAKVVGDNVVREMENRPLKTWEHNDKGTAISVGHDAVATGVDVLPVVDTFDGFPAKQLKKLTGAIWIANVTSWNEARKSWKSL
ncbi:NAD(P)/FAD-dependent oxidoreductase [Natronobacterium gregoryi]|uniref:FAD-dependent pyridine nucleotide-disulfide oxidoreductase n=2 Tax=Natronobacterium gregoryi TaxID=44930 RepID=L0AE64_NATGS|nr:FAD-dependent oxidoreductase [Natronobacterium gregoryi]AFZ71442.1 NADH dehydrogenase, FAD-containing subunit [Natronobacterium gregoryi SP2]ELY66744.1 FAD-dependent pyridine nucleotide-disulfide oxidoreductase [Natronobacterium gregoryi SP2]PLK19964.1 NADH dehydrogenase FAD-containing subunit [Natronobacterium gregoryi SP2]SFJ35944.1 NADH dehydrogenase [Natronobacterium gregoryi]